MTTRNEMIAILKSENPTLRVGNEEDGYVNLSSSQYEATIAEWADNALAKEAKIAEEEANKAAREIALSKLAALGLDLDDLKSLGF